jgi:micrococcal nuclease
VLRGLSLILSISFVLGLSSCSSDQENASEGTVDRVIDSDTLQVTVDGKTETVRLLNVESAASSNTGQSAECLKPEATALVQQLLPPGTAVRLEFDTHRVDAAGIIVAAVFRNNKFVNESIALAGLGVADSRDGTGRFLPMVEKAQESARAERVGFFSDEVECTVPGRVRVAAGVSCASLGASTQVTPTSTGPTSSASASSTSGPTASATDTISPNVVGASSVELNDRAQAAAIVLANAGALQEWAIRDKELLIWRALNTAQRQACNAAIDELVQHATAEHSDLIAAIPLAQQQEAEAARVAAAESARVAEEQRAAAEAEAARAAEAQRVAAEAEAVRVAEEQRVAAEAEAARVEAEQVQAAEAAAAAETRAAQPRENDASSSSKQPTSNSSPPGSPSTYTGLRCYAPGGKTWKPC